MRQDKTIYIFLIKISFSSIGQDKSKLQLLLCTVVPVLSDHCKERPPAVYDHFFMHRPLPHAVTINRWLPVSFDQQPLNCAL